MTHSRSWVTLIGGLAILNALMAAAPSHAIARTDADTKVCAWYPEEPPEPPQTQQCTCLSCPVQLCWGCPKTGCSQGVQQCE